MANAVDYETIKKSPVENRLKRKVRKICFESEGSLLKPVFINKLRHQLKTIGECQR